MEKTISNLIRKLGTSGQVLNKSGYMSIKGGISLSSQFSTNAGCTNAGVSCSGTNTGNCTNDYNTDCSRATNKAARSACSNLSCVPL